MLRSDASHISFKTDIMISFRKIFIDAVLIKRYLVHHVRMKTTKDDALKIFLKSVEAVQTKTLIDNAVILNNNHQVSICGKQYELNNNCYAVGFGKAVFDMSLSIESILCCHLVRGISSIPAGTLDSQTAQKAARDSKHFVFIEGAKNNLPDTNSERAATQICELVRNLKQDDLLIILISGGGSALLSLPKPPVTLKEKTDLIKLLSTRGANIIELNCVRKRLSEVKGGGLAQLAYPANVVALILSDVIGDPLDSIASGPTVPNSDAADAAMKIIEKYGITEQIPQSIQTILSSKPSTEFIRISPDGNFIHVTNFVIGSNKLAARKASEEAKRLGYESTVISVTVSGDVAVISDAYARIAIGIAKVMKGLSSREELRECLSDIQYVLNIPEEIFDEVISLKSARICLVSGGEPTVEVRGAGKGGRNQQLALQFAIDVNNAIHRLEEEARESVKSMNIILLSGGTDGIDGPTDAAGALGFPQLCIRAESQALDALDYVTRNDSYNFYKQFDNGSYLVMTGHTGTNVMDIHVMIIENV